MGRLSKGNIQVEERRQRVRVRQKTQRNMSESGNCARKETKRVNVCDRTVTNKLREMGFPIGKAELKPSLTPKEKKRRSQWAVDGGMKVIFGDKSTIWNFSLVQIK